MRYKDLIINNYTCNGQCSNCGQCCGDILHLSNQEIKRIDDYLKTHKVEETPRCIIYEYDNTCPFRDNENKKCKIYAARPEICRSYKCDKSPEEAYKNRELTNNGKLPRSMRNIFFNDNKGATWLFNICGMPIFDRNNRIISNERN